MADKEVRFGISQCDRALDRHATTDASNGSVNGGHDAFTPAGGAVPLVNIFLGEVIFGGVGSGLYGMFFYILIAVFVAGLMVGRTPEYLGKKIEAREIKYAALGALFVPTMVLALDGRRSMSAVARHGPVIDPPTAVSRRLHRGAVRLRPPRRRTNNGSSVRRLPGALTSFLADVRRRSRMYSSAGSFH